jgi:UDP-N-acetylmuramoyl-tripeptide--D-alanyl-D-alanine ligase
MSTVGELCKVIDGRLLPDAMAAAPLGVICGDSRRIAPGEVFWALTGKQFDGGQFAPAAFARGAAGAVVARDIIPPPGCWAIRVADTHRALDAWAIHRRRRAAGTVIAVAGSAGKTTAQRMIHAVLAARLRGTAGPMNCNSRLGLPLCMTAIEPDHDYAVLELGASRPGEIAEMARLCAPKIGVITCIGQAHLEGFGDVRRVAAAKCELLETLPPDGRAVLADDPRLRKMAPRCRAEIVWIGSGDDCELRAEGTRMSDGRLTFRVGKTQFALPVQGRHHVTAALAAAAVGRMLGFDLDEIARVLYKFPPLPMRCQVVQFRGATIINDACDSNPTSLLAALELLSEFDTTGRRIALLGDMDELGRRAEKLHRQAGRQAVEIGRTAVVIACGQFATEVIAGARAAGLSRIRAIACRSALESLPHLEATSMPGDVLLIKGARSMRMETVIESLATGPRMRIAG